MPPWYERDLTFPVITGAIEQLFHTQKNCHHMTKVYVEEMYMYSFIISADVTLQYKDIYPVGHANFFMFSEHISHYNFVL